MIYRTLIYVYDFSDSVYIAFILTVRGSAIIIILILLLLHLKNIEVDTDTED